ncbi:MAG: (Fe-S)-binding protein [Armatimonadetes bacterium]|nr:(Fe-S)-binding protein [Armatimonadota bacterium]
MRVQLMLTCLCDAFYGEVGIATVKVLEQAGAQVEFAEGQTCCGQPPFNAGDWDSARRIALRAKAVFRYDVPIVTPSASCAAMMHEGYDMLGLGPAPCYELSQFLLGPLSVTSWPALPSPRKAVFHRSCHGRMLGLGPSQERLLGLVPGLELVQPEQADQCCGFGGAFCVTHGATSRGIGLEKLERLRATGVTDLIGGDMGCLAHLKGLADREGPKLEVAHFAEVLASCL